MINRLLSATKKKHGKEKGLEKIEDKLMQTHWIEAWGLKKELNDFEKQFKQEKKKKANVKEKKSSERKETDSLLSIIKKRIQC